MRDSFEQIFSKMHLMVIFSGSPPLNFCVSLSFKTRCPAQSDKLLSVCFTHLLTERALFSDVVHVGVLLKLPLGHEAGGGRRERVGKLELEIGGGHNGKWSILCALGFGCHHAVRHGLECGAQIGCLY